MVMVSKNSLESRIDLILDLQYAGEIFTQNIFVFDVKHLKIKLFHFSCASCFLLSLACLLLADISSSPKVIL